MKTAYKPNFTIAALLTSVLIATASQASPQSPKSASDATKAANQTVREYLPFEDTRDFTNARRGFIATLDDTLVKNAEGGVAYDTAWYAFLDGDAPDTVNPSLWRQSTLNAIDGLFEVTKGVYQVRGFDLANVSFIRGKTGWIVVDPLMSNETAAAALHLVKKHVEDLPVTAIIFTHSHIDHFGGGKGVVDPKVLAAGDIPVIAPEGFFIESVNENLMAGNTMSRRAMYMYGNMLPRNPTGTVGSGLGTTTSSGTHTIIAPTVEISTNTTQGDEPTEMMVDGVKMLFHFTPDAEAPAELMFWIPEYKALMQAEEINHTLHNLYTLRGAKVRNGLLWSRYIHDTLGRYGDKVEISFGSHHWPTWGNQEIVTYWKGQRDIYRYLHDEVLRLANHGMTMLEVAEEIELPDSLAKQFANRGYYGSVSHNAKSQYQLYFGWFSGNPSELWELPPAGEAAKFVEYAGGADAVIKKARKDFDAGNYRWVATALNHVMFAEPDNKDAAELLADTLEQLGYQAESGPWRNFYLTGAKELREGVQPSKTPIKTSSPDIVRALALDTYLDYLAVRLNGPKAAASGGMSINLTLPDAQKKVGIVVENGVMNYTVGRLEKNADVSVTMDRAVLDDINLHITTIEEAVASGAVKITGNADKFNEFLALLDRFDLYFNIVTP